MTASVVRGSRVGTFVLPRQPMPWALQSAHYARFTFHVSRFVFQSTVSPGFISITSQS